MSGIWSLIVHRVIKSVKRWDNAAGASFWVESRGEEGEEIRGQHFSVLPTCQRVTESTPANLTKNWLTHHTSLPEAVHSVLDVLADSGDHTSVQPPGDFGSIPDVFDVQDASLGTTYQGRASAAATVPVGIGARRGGIQQLLVARCGRYLGAFGLRCGPFRAPAPGR